MVVVFIPDLKEFLPLLHAARAIEGCTVSGPVKGYWQAEAKSQLVFTRKAMGLGPALWNSALTGGFCGRITEFGRDRLVIDSEDAE
jgi:hypothetical protein